MDRVITVLIAFFAISSVQAQQARDYRTRLCEENVSAAALKKYKKSARAFISDYYAWDSKNDQPADKYTGRFEVVVGIESQECYEGWEVQTKIEYLNSSRTPTCTIKKISYKDRDCA